MDLTDCVGLDFETYSSTDLLRHGLERYVKCPDFRPLLAAVAAYENGVLEGRVFDFVEDHEGERELLAQALEDRRIVAHNAGFEQAVLRSMGILVPSKRFIDSAVLARAAGAAGKMEAAAPQLLGVDKLESGYGLIKLFSIPGKYQLTSTAFDPAIRMDHLDDWVEFARYCMMDAKLSLGLAALLLPETSVKELQFNAVTMDMNNVGWSVDLNMVYNMQERYLRNVNDAVENFRIGCNAPNLNLNSTPQLIAWCKDRGVRATSFDEQNVAKMLEKLDKALAGVMPDSKRDGYEQVYYLLKTKQTMGGSSLKKLQTIIDTVGYDGRLHDQYLHCGAGATYRTTGRGVQMQNLKRLNGEGDDMAELLFEDTDWDNTQLAANLRQVFTASNTDGLLIVGDFSSVESRGLAWQAGEEWKLQAYRDGRGVYEELAARKFSKPVEQVVKQERTFGKVGELSCGYQAGPPAVRDFAAKMNIQLSELESIQLVTDWRTACPETVGYWHRLNEALHEALEDMLPAEVMLQHGYYVRITPRHAPDSLRVQVRDRGLRSLDIKMVKPNGFTLFRRVIHGTHFMGRNIHYWKPSERKTGDLWTDTWMNPKTKQAQPFTIYGGKLAGLLTQSLCREVFFDSLHRIHLWCQDKENVKLVGQFHDEIVLDWVPGPTAFYDTAAKLQDCMTTTTLPGFPLAAEIKSDYRYTK